MEYFWIKQDQRYDRVPVIRNLRNILDVRDLTPQCASRVEDRNIVFSSSPYSQDYIDVLDKQFFLVSDLIKKIMELYDSSVKYKLFCILNNLADEYAKYYAPIFHEVDALSLNSEMNLDRSCVKKLVLKKEVVQDYAFCKIANLRTNIIVIRLDMAESILRRQPKGIQIIKTEFESIT